METEKKEIHFNKEKMLEGCRAVLTIIVTCAIVYFCIMAAMAWIHI